MACESYEECTTADENPFCRLKFNACNNNADCVENDICNTEKHICRTPQTVQCTLNTDCFDGEICHNNYCKIVLTTECDVESDCAIDEVCYNNRCKFVECKTNDDCNNNEYCENSRCKTETVNPDFITIRGVVSNVSTATVKIYSTDDNSFLGETIADESGNFVIQIDKNKVFEGFRIRAFNGTIGETEFTEDLSAIYFKSDNLFENSNVTPVTTLIHRYSDVFEDNPYIDRKISLSIQKLHSIGMIKKEDMNSLNSDYVEEDKIAEEILNGSGIEGWLKNIKNELNENTYFGTAKYFPNVNGGISEVTVDRAENITQVFKGRTFEANVEVFKYKREDEREFLFELTSFPEGMTISEEGKLTFSVPDNSETQIHNYSVRVTDLLTGIKHILNGKIDVMETNVILSGTIGAEGGVLSDYYGDYVLTVPENAVDTPTEFKIFRAINEETGFYSYVVDAEGNSVIVDFKYPEGLKPEISRTRKLTKATKSSSMSEVTEYDVKANFIGNKRLRFNANYITGKVKDYKIASKLYKYPSNYSDLKPVLLVHGYQPFNDMAGDEYWADTARLLTEKGYTVYEFRWLTNARFGDVADDLAKAIDLITQKTRRTVTLIAHSFGGLLSRTYLQNYATKSGTVSKYNNDVQSLITVGTPHSGIFDEEWIGDNGGIYFGVDFPAGQDGISDSLLEACDQLSCHQAGESILGGLSYSEISNYGITENPGELVANLSKMQSGHQMPVDTLVLIGLKWKLDNQMFAEDIYRYENGDGLISYEGQRFLPNLRTSARLQNGLTLSGGKKVYEKVLGGVWESKPNSTVGTETQADNNEIFQYEHSAATPGNGIPEVVITDGNKNFHHTYLEILVWLSQNPTNIAPVLYQNANFKFKIIDDLSGLPIPTAKLKLSRTIGENSVFTPVNQNGEVTIVLWTKVNTEITYTYTIDSIPGYRTNISNNTFTFALPDTPNNYLNIGEIRLQREVVEGLLPGEDICDGIDCGGIGECVTESSMAKCSCPEGTIEEGLSCKITTCPAGQHIVNGECVSDNTTINYCEGITCSGHGTCENDEINERAICNCQAGYHRASLTTCVVDGDWDLVSAGLYHTCGIKGGALFCWGDNSYGQLGTGDTDIRLTPTQIGSETTWSEVKVIYSSSTTQSTCAIKSGKLYCWGKQSGVMTIDTFGENTDVCNEDLMYCHSPVLVSQQTGWNQISTAGYALKNGEIYQLPILNQIGTDNSWSYISGAYGIKNGELYNNFTSKVGAFTDWEKVSNIYNSYSYHTCGLRSTGEIYCWGGSNSSGQIGNGTTTSVSSPTKVGTLSDWVDVEVFSGHTCGIRSNGELRCWGYNANGELGLGDYDNKLIPIKVGDSNGWQSLSLGGGYTCGINGGNLKCWGYNLHGQLGLGEEFFHKTPKLIDAGGWSSISGSGTSVLGIKNAKLYALGNNSGNRFGIQFATTLQEPTIVNGIDWKDIYITSKYSFGITTIGELYYWGDTQVVPLKLENGNGWSDIEFYISSSYLAYGIKNGELYRIYLDSSVEKVGTENNWNKISLKTVGSDNWNVYYYYFSLINNQNFLYTLLKQSNQNGQGISLQSENNWTDVSSNCSITAGNLSCYQDTTGYDFTQLSGWDKVFKDIGNMAIRNGKLYSWKAISVGTYGGNNYYSPQQIGTDSDWQDVTSYCGIKGGNLYCWNYSMLSILGKWSWPNTPQLVE